MHERLLGILAVALILVSVGCVTQRTPLRSSGNRPPPIVVTSGPPEFRHYDEAFINTVRNRWFDLLDNLPWAKTWTGKVIVSVHLHDDGRITDPLVLKNTTSVTLGKLCERAITDSQPYPVWPHRMREIVKKRFRILEISFYYD